MSRSSWPAGRVEVGVDLPVAERHLGDDQVHADDLGQRLDGPRVLGAQCARASCTHSSLRNANAMWKLLGSGPDGRRYDTRRPVPCPRDRPRPSRCRAHVGDRFRRRRSRPSRFHRQPVLRCGAWPSSWRAPASASSSRCCRATGRASRTWSAPGGPTGRRRPSRPISIWPPGATGWSSSGSRWAARWRAWLAESHPEISGLVLVNPLVEPPGPELFDAVRELLAAGAVVAPGIGSDIALPDAAELSYEASPLEGAAVPLRGGGRRGERPRGHPVPGPAVLEPRGPRGARRPTATGWRRSVAGPVERMWLERSYHVATLDYDRDEVEARTVAFASRVLGGVAG